MKKIMIIAAMILMIGTAIAFTVGNNLSQTQIDSLDVPSLDLSNGFVRDAQNNVVYDCEWRGWNKVCFVYGNFTIVNPNYDENKTLVDYSTSYHIETFPFNVDTYRDIKQQHNLTYAKEALRINLKGRYARYDQENKEEIEKYQTKVDYDVEELLAGIDLE